jgi:pyridoxine/pyridoxamine 5'-phosphate oxidase
MRTLVLREVDDQLAVFVNATSPKWQQMQSGFVLHTYWPSVQVQYRMHVEATPVDPRLVHESWRMRPDPPKRMDWFYEQHHTQSSPIESREVLLARLNQVRLPDPLTAPKNARGLLLEPFEIERLDLTQPEGVHDRQLFVLGGDGWQRSTLVP